MTDVRARGFAERLGERLPALTAGAPGRVHVAAWELGGRRHPVSLADRRPVRAASTIKLPILVAALEAVAAGKLDLSARLEVPPSGPSAGPRAGGSGVLQHLPHTTAPRLEELLTLMVIVSDNAATNVVIDALGMDAVNRSCQAHGLAGTHLERHLMDLDAAAAGRENRTSAWDQAHLLDRLAGGDLLPGDLRDFALRTLHAQQIRDRLPALLPPEAVIGNKTGELPDLRHDVGLLTAPPSPPTPGAPPPDGYAPEALTPRQAVIAVLIDDIPPAPARATLTASQTIAEIARSAWQALTA